MNDNKKYIPKYLNAQIQFLWWELDEMIVLIIFMTLGIITNHTYVGVLIGFVIMQLYTKIKTAKQPGYFKHLLYKYGLWGNKVVPEYWVKELGR